MDRDFPMHSDKGQYRQLQHKIAQMQFQKTVFSRAQSHNRTIAQSHKCTIAQLQNNKPQNHNF